MAVIENVTTESGDVLLIKPEVPIVGLIVLYQFTDTTINETLTNYYVKEFRYSRDGGLTWTDWMNLSIINISYVNTEQVVEFVIEYRYTAVGTPPPLSLTFKDILVVGTLGSVSYPEFDDTIFSKFFTLNDISVFGWALNVLEKLYVKGLILPDYIERAENNSNLEDEDFIVFWNSITHYFAIIVYFARQFEHIESNEIMLTEFIKNKDLAFTSGNDLEDLLYLYQHYVYEYQKRGTTKILEKKVNNETIDGELRRLINYKEFDSFLFYHLKNYNTGWCVGKSSPCWSNTSGMGEDFSEAIEYFSPKEDYVIVISVIPDATTTSFTFQLSCLNKEDSSVSILNFNTNSPVLDPTFTLTDFPVAGIEYILKVVIWNKDKSRDFSSKSNMFNIDSLQLVPEVCVINLNLLSQVGSGDVAYYNIKPLKFNFTRGQIGVHNLIYMGYVNNNGDLSDEKIKDRVSDELVSFNTYVRTKLY